MNPVTIYKVEQIHAVDGIADGDTWPPERSQPRLIPTVLDIDPKAYPFGSGWFNMLEVTGLVFAAMAMRDGKAA